MEESMISVLRSYGLSSFWKEGETGVWLLDSQNRKRKIASLGIAVRKGVSYHGLALNVATDLRHFSLISPCGYESNVMTSMEELLGQVDYEEVSVRLDLELRARLEKVEAAAPLSGDL